MLAGVLGIVVALALFALMRNVVPTSLDRTPVRLELLTPGTLPDDSSISSLALSADGRQLVFVAETAGITRLWLRRLDQRTAQELAGTDGARYPFWAPDGNAVAFFADGKLKRLDLPLETSPRVLADAPNGRGGTWNDEGAIVFAPALNTPLFRVSSVGGRPEPVTDLKQTGHSTHRHPQFLPDGRFLFYANFSDTGAGMNGVYLG